MIQLDTEKTDEASVSEVINFDRLFEDNRETGENRLKQCQLVMLRMLKIFDYLCNKYNIQYFLTGGSLLGAIRHKGFIPWDDDLDVGMTRLNYEKFVSYAAPHLPADIFFQNRDTDPEYPYSEMVEARLRDKYSSYAESKNKFHEGLQVDIFVYDRSFVPNNFLIIVQNMLLGLLNSDSKRANILKWIEKKFPLPLVYASSYLQNLGMLKQRGTYKTKKEISQLIKVPFEDIEAWVPAGWDSFLKRQYGDYMKLPNVEKQKGHHSQGLPDPFTPCVHNATLKWQKRQLRQKSSK